MSAPDRYLGFSEGLGFPKYSGATQRSTGWHLNHNVLLERTPWLILFIPPVSSTKSPTKSTGSSTSGRRLRLCFIDGGFILLMPVGVLQHTYIMQYGNMVKVNSHLRSSKKKYLE